MKERPNKYNPVMQSAASATNDEVVKPTMIVSRKNRMLNKNKTVESFMMASLG